MTSIPAEPAVRPSTGKPGQATSLHSRMVDSVDGAPDRIALVVEGRRYTYAEVHGRALRLAARIDSALSQGESRQARVALLSGRGADAYIAILAILYAGACVAPLLADFPKDRTADMLQDLAPDLVVVDDQGAKVWQEFGRGEPFLMAHEDHSDETVLFEPRWNQLDDPAYVLFTSGSTGRPKGVVLTHGNLLTYFALTDLWYSWSNHDVFSQAANLNWDSSVSDVWSAWGAGGTLVPVPPTAYRDLPAFLTSMGITVWFSAPSVISLVRRCGKLVPGSMPSLTHAIFGGEALRWTDMAAWQEAAPGCAVINVYGPTETTITTHRHVYREGETKAAAVNGIAPLGHVHPGTLELLTTPDGAMTTVEGELWLGGPQVSSGYILQSVESQRFRERDGVMWYRTGDVVKRLPNGELGYLGRVDGQVQVQGLRVEIAEVEQAIESLAGVQQAVVVAVPEGDSTALRVWYLADQDVLPSLFHRHLRTKLPEVVIPRWYRRLDELPLNANRKVDRKLLQQRAREAQPHMDLE